MNRAEKRRQQKLAAKAKKKSQTPVAQAPSPQPPSAAQQTDLDLAVQHHTQGRLQEAEALYRKILQAEPTHPMALHLLGVLAHQVGNKEAAVDLITQALNVQPVFPEALNNLGNILQEQGKLEQALSRFRMAIEQKPDYPEPHYNLGNTLKLLDRPSEAQESYHAALRLRPQYADAIHNLGNVNVQLGELEEAARNFKQAIAVNPGLAEAHGNLGDIQMVRGEVKEAEASYARALAAKPDYAKAHGQLGEVLLKKGQLEEAIAHFAQATSLDPTYAEAFNGWGNALKGEDKFDEAIDCFLKAITAKPDHVEAHNNLALAYKSLGQMKQAEQFFAKALTIDPGSDGTRFNFGMLQLLTGDFAEGWSNYSARWKVEGFASRQRNFKYKEPFWGGPGSADEEAGNGKKLLVWMEQGVGDEVMFSSLLPDLMKVTTEIAVECDERLIPLFERSFPDIAFMAHQENDTDDLVESGFLYQLPAGDLGRYFRSSAEAFPTTKSFLQPDQDQSTRLRQDYSERWPGKRLIGISWRSGNATVGVKRSSSLESFEPILNNPECQFINLQYGDVKMEVEAFKKRTGVEVYDDAAIDPLKDMDGFASQIAALDQVISIDNSTVHMSGALGVPTWVLLPFIPNWRWLLEGETSPWYPSLRLFRQTSDGDWQAVIERVRQALLDLK